MSEHTQYLKAQAEYSSFLDAFDSLILATVNEDGTPLASYSPFVVTVNRVFYVFVSGLAQHTQNLQRTPQASIMLIEDEKTAAQVFARKRLTYGCQTTFLPRDTAEWREAARLYQSKFGKMFELLHALPDFTMFRLEPLQGRFVLGFGKAYRVAGNALDRLERD